MSLTIEYPTSDGRPMGETDVHRQQILDLIVALEYCYQQRTDVYVSGNLLMFYQEGDPYQHRSPDVLVTLGIARKLRDNYKVWEEGKAPDLIIEVTSLSTRREDLVDKFRLYSRLGVQEYVIFDPLREYLEPAMHVYRLSGADYLPLPGAPLLQTVGLVPEIVDQRMRLRDPVTNRWLPTMADLIQEHRRAEQAEAELRQLREELRRLKPD